MESPISIVMITRDRRSHVLESLEHLCRLPEHPPIIVVDNASSDGTVTAVSARFPQVRIIAVNENRGASARTLGVRAVETPYVAFSDDDSWWEPGALREAVRIFEEYPRLGLIAGKVLLGGEERMDPFCVEMEQTHLSFPHPLPGPFVLGFVACGAIVRREAYLRSGGFDRRFGVGGEEALLALDLASEGWGLAYVDRIVAHHFPSPLRDLRRRKQVLTRNQLWVNWLRRSRGAALEETLQILRRSLRDPNSLRGVLQAIEGLRWALRERRPVPDWVEKNLTDAPSSITDESTRQAA